MATQTYQEQLSHTLEESIRVKQAVLSQLVPTIEIAANWIIETLKNDHKLLLVGNGGSAADAQHIAAEFIGRFEKERQPWPVIALTTDTSILTALTNDYSVEIVFARQVAALGRPNDLMIAISTSGNSPNIVSAIREAKKQSMRVIGFTGESGGAMASLCDLAICIPSSRTARIQEAYMMVLHALCEVVERALTQDSH